MSKRLEVSVIPDGPMRVRNAGAIRFCGELLEVDGDAWLCRCGASGNAPFCDGSHRPVGFRSDDPAPEAAEVRVWEGRTLRTHFDAGACMHVFTCKPLKALREAELAGDDEAAIEIARVVDQCPSGALRWEAKAALAVPAPPARACAVDIQEGGEVRIQVPFDIDVARSADLPEDRATLCRCGQSRNKPWCDGRHRGKKGFR